MLKKLPYAVFKATLLLILYTDKKYCC